MFIIMDKLAPIVESMSHSHAIKDDSSDILSMSATFTKNIGFSSVSSSRLSRLCDARTLVQ